MDSREDSWILYALAMAAAVLFGAGCGAPADYDAALHCGGNVYIARDVTAVGCADVFREIAYAEQATGISLAPARIIVETHIEGDAWGKTWTNDDMEIYEHALRSLVHEAYHLRASTGHCNWSSDGKNAVFEATHTAGAYDDECAHVHCKSTQLWDTDGQYTGKDYTCLP